MGNVLKFGDSFKLNEHEQLDILFGTKKNPHEVTRQMDSVNDVSQIALKHFLSKEKFH